MQLDQLLKPSNQVIVSAIMDNLKYASGSRLLARDFYISETSKTLCKLEAIQFIKSARTIRTTNNLKRLP